MVKGYIERLYIEIDGERTKLNVVSKLLNEEVAISGPLKKFETFEELCDFVKKNHIPEMYYMETPLRHTPMVYLGYAGDIGAGKINKDTFSPTTSIIVEYKEFGPSLDFVIKSDAELALKYIKERMR